MLTLHRAASFASRAGQLSSNVRHRNPTGLLPMLSFKSQGVRFNVRAAAVILEDGYLLLHRAEGDTFWVLPGGRVEMGEAAADATARELMEETGQSIACGDLAFCVENFFEWQGEISHELGYYFYASLPSGSPLSDKLRSHEAREGNQRLEYRWFEINSLRKLPLYPEFLRTANLTKGAPPRHVVQGVPGRRPASDA